MRLENWLPSVERARVWNDWTEDELMLKLARHLCECTLQEWSVLNSSDKASYTKAVKALRLHLDPGSCTLAAQELHHTSQGDHEKVADFTKRLE